MCLLLTPIIREEMLIGHVTPSTYPGTRYAYQKYSFTGQRKSSCSSKEESIRGKKPVHSWENLSAFVY